MCKQHFVSKNTASIFVVECELLDNILVCIQLASLDKIMEISRYIDHLLLG